MKLRRWVATSSLLLLAACGGSQPPLPTPPPVPPPPPPAPCPTATAAIADPLVPTPAKSPEEALARLFTAAKIEAAWFTTTFVDHIPTQKVEGIVVEIKKESGAFQRVEKSNDGLYVVFEKGRVPSKVTLDKAGRIASLWFGPTETTEKLSLAQLKEALAALPGKVSAIVITDGVEGMALDAETPRAVGSAFKLAILDALREKIEAKRAAWSDVVRLETKHKSLPSGSLHTWPEKAPITLHTLSSLMMSVSDNTATDVLLDYVGRENAEKRAPGNAPFMSTREAFVLKAKKNRSLLERWRAGDAGARRKMLLDLASTKLDEDDDYSEPSIDVEWNISARQLCSLLAKNKSLDVTRINPGVATKKDWDLVAYKGGSEPGVLNLSTWVEKGGKKHCLVTTWNDPQKDVEKSKLFSLHAAMLRSLLAVDVANNEEHVRSSSVEIREALSRR